MNAVGVRYQWVGSAALWEPSALVEGVLTIAEPAAVGMASVAAAFGPLPAGHARYLRFGPGRTVRAVLAPGLVRDMEIAEVRQLGIGESVPVDPEVTLLALDGERRLAAVGTVLTPRSGPYLLEPYAALARRLGSYKGRRPYPTETLRVGSSYGLRDEVDHRDPYGGPSSPRHVTKVPRRVIPNS